MCRELTIVQTLLNEDNLNTKNTVGTLIDVIIKIVVAILLIIFIYKGALLAYGYGYRVFTEEPVTTGEGRTISVEIKKGESAKTIGKMLESKGLIRDYKLFVIQEGLSGYRKMEKAGIYDLNTSMTTDEMLAVISGEKTSTSTSAETTNETYYVDNNGNESETGGEEAGTASE